MLPNSDFQLARIPDARCWPTARVAAAARLPLGLKSIVAPTFLGFALLNTFTFGVDFRLARILVGGCEAVYMYSAMRWIVFRR